jgi:hypothetical protein
VICAGETANTAAAVLFPGKLGATGWPTELRDLFAPQGYGDGMRRVRKRGPGPPSGTAVRTKQLIVAACQLPAEHNRDAEEDFEYDSLTGPKNSPRCVLCK